MWLSEIFNSSYSKSSFIVQFAIVINTVLRTFTELVLTVGSIFISITSPPPLHTPENTNQQIEIIISSLREY